MLYALITAGQIIVLIVIGILLWQIWRAFRSAKEDEILGQERTDYMTRRLTWLTVLAIAEAVLQIAGVVLRSLL